MPDRPGSFKSSHNVSRHTIVMRKAKDDDARRLAEKEASARLPAAGEGTPTPSAKLALPGDRESGRGGRRVSGKTVVVQREGEISKRLTVSTRLSGRQAASVRVTGGDTIIRYQSGDMVIKRGARRARLRRHLIWAYALGYLALFGTYIWFLVTGVYTVTPLEYVDKSFSRRHSGDVPALELAALEAMIGNRTPAEIRLAETLTFYDENKERVQIEAGSRLTLLTAAKLGHAILVDQEAAPSRRAFSQPLRVYRDTFVSTLDWPHILSLYNSLGFFLLLILFLWRPMLNYLGTEGRKTAIGLRNAREAQEEAAAYRDKYRKLAADIEERDAGERKAIRREAKEERKKALDAARARAREIEGRMSGAIERETEATATRIGAGMAALACDRAKDLLAARLGQAEHDAAIDELIADITNLRVSG